MGENFYMTSFYGLKINLNKPYYFKTKESKVFRIAKARVTDYTLGKDVRQGLTLLTKRWDIPLFLPQKIAFK